MANDFDRLKNEADIEEVVSDLGMDVHRNGSNYFVLCPLPSHDDKHPTNCYFKKGWNNLYCTTCGTSIKAIDLIMYETGCSYGEAADRLWELEGRPDWYRDKTWKSKNTQEKKTFSLTGKEARILGIKLPKSILTPCECHSIKYYPSSNMPKGKEYDPLEVDNYLVSKRNKVIYKDFIDEETLKQLAFTKAKEKLFKYKAIQDLFVIRGIIEPTTKLFEEEQQIIKSVVKRIVYD